MARRYGEEPEDKRKAQGSKRSPLEDKNSIGTGAPPTAKEVEFIHKNSDVDARPESQHHTLGHGPAQASPGDHNHRDGRSLPILEGVTLTGTKSGTNVVVLSSIIAALVQLGASDGTS